jgi:hypothetical protein
MGKTVTVTLDGADYNVPKLNLGQLERASEALVQQPKERLPFEVLRIAFERVVPVTIVSDLEPDAGELQTAVTQILALSGLRKKDPVPDGTKVPDSGEPQPAAAG